MTICDVCGDQFDGDPHEPHDPSCDAHGQGCDCDWIVCPDCCWTCTQEATS